MGLKAGDGDSPDNLHSRPSDLRLSLDAAADCCPSAVRLQEHECHDGLTDKPAVPCTEGRNLDEEWHSSMPGIHTSGPDTELQGQRTMQHSQAMFAQPKPAPRPLLTQARVEQKKCACRAGSERYV